MNKNTITIQKRQKLIASAGIIALTGNLLLAIAKLTVGFITESLSVMGDGVDTTTDVIIAGMTLVIGSIISRPSDKSHPWGHGRAETMGTLALSFVIFFAGIQLGISAVTRLNTVNFSTNETGLALLVTIISIVVKFILAVSQLILAKMTNSSMIRANAQNMINDIIISASVLLGLILTSIYDSTIIDPIIALLVSIWIIKNAIQIFWEMNTELMDGSASNEVYQQLFKAVHLVEGASNPHRVRIRKIANFWDVDLDIEVNANLTVKDAHEIAEKVTIEIKNAIPDIYDIMVHIEPEGYESSHCAESFGLREDDIS